MLNLAHAPVLFAFFGTTLGALYTDPSQLTKTTYDFVVVGAGTAGNVVAARLSENPSVSVLVIEAGVSNTGYRSEQLQAPLLGPQASVNSPFDWNYTTVPQKALNNQVLPYYRGFVLGGSSSTNFLTWTRGARDDYDKFAKVVGDNSFSWNKLLPFFKKSEQWVHPTDGRNDSGQYDPSVHGHSGPVYLSVTGNLSAIDPRVMATTQELSSEFPFNIDTNSGNLLGVGWIQSHMGFGKRSSSATAYLQPALDARTNIDVLIETRVTKLLKTGTSGGLPEFKSLNVAKTASSTPTVITARKEIILSAGSIGSPQILMLSGIGNPSDLTKVGITPQVTLREVGKNLQDHPLFTAQWKVRDDADTFDPLTLAGADPAPFLAAFAEWNANKTGLLTAVGGNHMGFFRLPRNSPLLRRYGDPAPGPGSAHYELAWQNGFVSVSQPFPSSGRYISNIHVLNSPTSRGTVTLQSSSAFTQPLIDPNFYSSEFDLQTMVYAVRSAQRFIRSSAWSDYIVSAYTDSQDMFAPDASDETIIAYIRKWTHSIKHPMCTAAMHKDSDKGVVDNSFKVKKIKGVRIVDAAVFPFVPSAHPVAGIFGIAELAASKIKSFHGI